MIDFVNEVVQVTVAATYSNGQVEEVGLHYVCVVAGGSDTRAALGATVYTDLQAQLTYMLPANKMYGVKVALPKKFNDPTLVRPNPVTQIALSPGTSASTQAVPTQCRPVLQFTGSVTGRKGRGRMYLFTPSGDVIGADGNPTMPAYPATMQTMGNTLATPIVAGGSQWNPILPVILPGPWPNVYYQPITSALFRKLMGTQRRSGSGYGRLNAAPW